MSIYCPAGAKITGPVLVKNNIFLSNDTLYAIDAGVLGYFTFANNLTAGSPNFVNPTTATLAVLAGPNDATQLVRDFHLGAGSAAIGSGATLTGGAASPYTDVTKDFDAVSRVVPWDAGAYQYGSGAPTGTVSLSVR